MKKISLQGLAFVLLIVLPLMLVACQSSTEQSTKQNTMRNPEQSTEQNTERSIENETELKVNIDGTKNIDIPDPNANIENKLVENSISFFAMDTFMEIKAYGASQELLEECKAEVERLEKLLSVNDEASEIYALNHRLNMTVSEETAELISYALSMYKETNESLDISIRPVLTAWGFTGSKYRLPSDEELQKIISLVDATKVSINDGVVTMKPSMEIDLGSIAKGYAADQITKILEAHRVNKAIINLGGNVQCIGSGKDNLPWRVGIRDGDGEGLAAKLEVKDKAVVTSGVYERNFLGEDGRTYWHIIDPKTAYPARTGLSSVTIVDSKGLEADALSTALFVMGAEAAADYWRSHKTFEFMLITDTGKLQLSAGLKGSFSPLGAYTDKDVVWVE